MNFYEEKHRVLKLICIEVFQIYGGKTVCICSDLLEYLQAKAMMTKCSRNGNTPYFTRTTTFLCISTQTLSICRHSTVPQISFEMVTNTQNFADWSFLNLYFTSKIFLSLVPVNNICFNNQFALHQSQSSLHHCQHYIFLTYAYILKSQLQKLMSNNVHGKEYETDIVCFWVATK